MRGTVQAMIGYLEGTLKSAGDRWVIVDRSGVGWSVTPTFDADNGAHVEVWITTTWREASGPDFWAHTDVDGRDTFEALCAVHGVGPATAASITTTLGPAGLAGAVANGDVTPFKPVRGVGPKVAARILADVKLPERILTGAGVAAPAAPRVAQAPADELAAALVGLGFDAERSEIVVAEVRSVNPDGGEEELLAAALALLAA